MFEVTCNNCSNEWDLIEIDLAADTVDEYFEARDVCPFCGSSKIVFN